MDTIRPEGELLHLEVTERWEWSNKVHQKNYPPMHQPSQATKTCKNQLAQHTGNQEKLIVLAENHLEKKELYFQIGTPHFSFLPELSELLQLCHLLHRFPKIASGKDGHSIWFLPEQVVFPHKW